MSTRIALGTTLLLTLGTAVAGTWMYGQGQSDPSLVPYPQVSGAQAEVAPEMMAMWKATAASTDYIAPKVPI